MEITVSRQDWSRNSPRRKAWWSAKQPFPILSNFSSRRTETVEHHGNRPRSGHSHQHRGQVKKQGSCTIPARKLYDYIKLLPDGDISSSCLRINGCKSAQAVPTPRWWAWRAPNFPQVPEFPAVAAQHLRAGPEDADRPHHLRHLNEESRYTLNGALLVIKAESLAMVGHRRPSFVLRREAQ